MGIFNDITNQIKTAIESLFYDSTLEAVKVTDADRIVLSDTETTANVIYLKYLSGRIDKIDKTDPTNTTYYTATSGTWADRTTLTYTEGGV